MQGPTPPTKPTPPTPPTMKTTSTSTSTDTHTPAPTVLTTQSTTPEKETKKPAQAEQGQPAEATPTTTTAPPLGSYSKSSTTDKETTSETGLPVPAPKKTSPISTGMTILLGVILLATIGIIVVRLLKNSKATPKPKINYAMENTEDLASLILSQTPADIPVAATPKTPPKKLLLKPAAKPEKKGGFEVRI